MKYSKDNSQWSVSTNLIVRIIDEKTAWRYVTNQKHSLHLVSQYKKRWQIETNFRERNNFIFKTQTRNFDVRYFAFALAGLLFNLWQLARKQAPSTMESYIFKKILKDELLKIWQ